jgi:hypothetical protein
MSTMSRQHHRREFLAEVGRGMLVAGVGATLAQDLGLASAIAEERPAALTFGPLEPLVGLLQDTPLPKLMPALVEKLKTGTDLKTLTAAAALANARTFGGNDYVGFHTFMALAPAYEMARELPKERQALPVLKVLYRNTSRIHAFGGRAKEMLHAVAAAELPKGKSGGEVLQAATRTGKYEDAESTFAAMAKGPPGEAFNHLQFSVEDEVDVHRVVLAWRAWDTLSFTGKEHAHTLLRQSVRYCVHHEQNRLNRGHPESEIRRVLPKLLDQHKLLAKPLGQRSAEDSWVEQLAQQIFAGSRAQAAEAVAAALAEGFSPQAVGDAISLAANLLVLHDPGRKQYTTPEKPAGSVHGDSVGVHASDAANAWRNIARVTDHRNTVASLIVGAFHTAGQSGWVTKEPWPYAEQLEKIKTKDCHELLSQTEEAIKAKDQARAAALVHRYGELNFAPRCMFNVLLRFGTSEDGALHAEKYYRTVSEEFASSRPAFRWRQLVALARVTASEYGRPAPGYEEACRLLKV